MYHTNLTEVTAAKSKNTKRDEITEIGDIEWTYIHESQDHRSEMDSSIRGDENQLELTFASSDLTKKLHLQPRANPIPSTQGSLSGATSPSDATSGPRFYHPNRHFPGMELVTIPVMIVNWLRYYWDAYETWTGPHGASKGSQRKRDSHRGPPVRRTHARSWNVLE
jgi:hypothetical protein